MKVPEKLYLHPTASGNVGASWLSFPLTDKDIEYTRTDAFIEKACKWLKDKLYDYAGEDDKRNIVPFDSSVFEDFCKAQKGE
jgi:hypothetical protein